MPSIDNEYVRGSWMLYLLIIGLVVADIYIGSCDMYIIPLMKVVSG